MPTNCPDSRPTDWTPPALKAYIDALFAAEQRQRDAAMNSMDKRLEGMNEFRATMNDYQTRTMPRTEYEARHKQLQDSIDGAKRFYLTTMISILAMIITIGTIIAFLVHS